METCTVTGLENIQSFPHCNWRMAAETWISGNSVESVGSEDFVEFQSSTLLKVFLRYGLAQTPAAQQLIHRGQYSAQRVQLLQTKTKTALFDRS